MVMPIPVCNQFIVNIPNLYRKCIFFFQTNVKSLVIFFFHNVLPKQTSGAWFMEVFASDLWNVHTEWHAPCFCLSSSSLSASSCTAVFLFVCVDVAVAPWDKALDQSLHNAFSESVQTWIEAVIWLHWVSEWGWMMVFTCKATGLFRLLILLRLINLSNWACSPPGDGRTASVRDFDKVCLSVCLFTIHTRRSRYIPDASCVPVWELHRCRQSASCGCMPPSHK